MNILLFILILGVLVLVHEFGHFIVAKKSGIRVDEFAIGFPPKIFSWKRGETVYSLNLLPIGGFVKIFGENPNEENISGPDSSRSFQNKNRFIQAMVISAGVIMNIVLAFGLFWVAIVIGLPVPQGYAGDAELLNSKTIVTFVAENSPAQMAGVKQGDVLMSLKQGEDLVNNPKMDGVREFISNHNGQEISLSVLRGEENVSLSVIPSENNGLSDRPAIGIGLGQTGLLKLDPASAFKEAFSITLYATGAIAIGLYDMVVGALSGGANLSDVAGPVGIVGLVGEASSFGIAYLLGFVALISANLAVLNALPVPALDGGRLLFVIVESVIRRPIKPVITNSLNLAGFALLMVLMVVVTYNDIAKLIG